MPGRRDAEIQRLLDAAEAVISRAADANERIGAAAGRIFAALQTPATEGQSADAKRLPVCRHLQPALDQARRQPGSIASLVEAFAAIESRLRWKTRQGAETHGEPFLNGHANADIVGAHGIEARDDVWVGVSLLAPQTRYPDHHHPPEEIYIVLSPGEWHNTDTPWHEPGIGGLVYNPPDIVHAMRSFDQPLLALWFLHTGESPA